MTKNTSDLKKIASMQKKIKCLKQDLRFAETGFKSTSAQLKAAKKYADKTKEPRAVKAAAYFKRRGSKQVKCICGASCCLLAVRLHKKSGRHFNNLQKIRENIKMWSVQI